MDAYRKCLENVCKAGIVTKSDFRNKEIFKCDHCNITLLRDVSAAKNILMKGLLSLPPGFIGG
jgi:transposase